MNLAPEDERPLDPPLRHADGERSGAVDAAGSPTILPIIDESLEVDKVLVDRGGYRLTKRVDVVDRVVEAQLHHESVHIERVPIGRALADGDTVAPRYEGDTLVVSVVEEVLVTEKRRMLVEEIRVTRIASVRSESQHVALRKESIEIERLGAGTSVIRSSQPPSDRQPNDPMGQPE